MKKVLILGHGYTGGYLFNSLKKDHDVEIVSKASLNYTDSDILETRLFEYKPDYVVNCSGYTGRPNVDGCEDNKEETLVTNVIGILDIVDVCKKFGIHCTVFATGCIFEYDEKHKDNCIDSSNVILSKRNSDNLQVSSSSECRIYALEQVKHNNNLVTPKTPFISIFILLSCLFITLYETRNFTKK